MTPAVNKVNEEKSKQTALLACGNRTPERCFASRQNREAVTRQIFATAKI
jgi:hypothetical protein